MLKINMQGARVVSLVGFVGVILGAFLPWSRVLIFSVSGTDGDGVITLLLGVAGASLIAFGRGSAPAWIAAVAGVAAFGVGLYDVANFPASSLAAIGMGLWLTLAASVLAAIAAAVPLALGSQVSSRESSE